MSSSFSQNSELLLPRRSAKARPASYYAHLEEDLTPAPVSDASLDTPVQMPRVRVTTASPLAPRGEPRAAKLKPKRSKLSMLLKPKDKAADPPTAAPRVSTISEAPRSFEVYTDPADDPEIGEIVVVQRKKSRVALGDVSWGNNAETELTVKSTIDATKLRKRRSSKNLAKENKDGEDKAGWWSRTIGRGQKEEEANTDGDVKQGRSKSPGPFRSLSRAMMNPLSRPTSPDMGRAANQRTHSSGTGSLLSISSGNSTGSNPIGAMPTDDCVPEPLSADSAYSTDVPPPSHSNPLPRQRPLGKKRSAILSFVSGRSVSVANPRVETVAEDKTSSLAIRAIKSVKSLARLSSWAQLRGTDEDHAAKNEEREAEKKAKKERKEKKEKRSSTSSATTGSISSVGTISSIRLAAGLPVAPAQLPMRARLSTGADSVLSSTSGGSGTRTSGNSSVRWDPSCVDTIQDRNRERERSERRSSTSSSSTKRNSVDGVVAKLKTHDSIERQKYSNRLAEGRRRGSLPSWADVDDSSPTASSFPVDAMLPPPTPPTPQKWQSDLQRSIVFTKEFDDDSDTLKWSISGEPSTPTPTAESFPEATLQLKRARPVSEQFLGHRSQSATNEDDTLTALNTATSDLASLINRLDLQTPESTPRRSVKVFTLDRTERMPSRQGSPVRRATTTSMHLPPRAIELDAPKSAVEQPAQTAGFAGGRGHQVSLTSLRPYAQCRTVARRVSGSATTMTVQETNQILTRRPAASRQPSWSQIGQDAFSAVENIPKLRPVPSIKDKPTAPAPSTALNISTLRASLRRRPADTIRSNDSKLPTVPASPAPASVRPQPAPAALPAAKAKTRPVLQTSPRPQATPPARTVPRKDVSTKTSNISRAASTTSSNVSTTRASTLKKPATPKTASTSSPVQSRSSSSPAVPRGPAVGRSRPTPRTSQVALAKEPETTKAPSTRPIGSQRRASIISSTSQPAPPERSHSLRPSSQFGRDQRYQLDTEPASDCDSSSIDQCDASSIDSTLDLSFELQAALDFVSDMTGLAPPTSATSRSRSPSLPSPGPPPEMPPPIPSTTSADTVRLLLPQRLSIPVFTGFPDDEDDGVDATTPTEVTSRSFDFTGEIAALTRFSAGDDDSFVEQLDTSFASTDLGVSPDSSFVAPPAGQPLPAPSMDTTDTDDTLLETLLAEMLHQEDEFSSDGDDESNEDQCVNLGPASRKSYGQLNTQFKFGSSSLDTAPVAESTPLNSVDHNLTFADIIPPFVHLNSGSAVDDEGFLNSGIGHVQDLPYSFEEARRQSVASFKEGHSASMVSLQSESPFKKSRFVRGGHSPSPSEVSFSGLSAYGDIRNKFEFGMAGKSLARPSAAWNLYMANVSATSLTDHGSGDGKMGGPVQMVRADDLTEPVDDTFAFQHRRHVRNGPVESNRSGSYLRPTATTRLEYHRDSSTWSNADFNGLPMSTVLRPGHKRSDARNSPDSVAFTHSQHSVNGSPTGSVCRLPERSRDSIGSEFSPPCFDRPGVSDRMFESAGFPLATIAASPSQSITVDQGTTGRVSVQSSEELCSSDPFAQLKPTLKLPSDTSSDKRTSLDSMFDSTHCSSMSSNSLFGCSDEGASPQGNLFGPSRLRTTSIISNASSNGSVIGADENFVTMLGGGRVRCTSLSSQVDGSPLASRRRRAREDGHGDKVQQRLSPVVPSPSPSKQSMKFGANRMDRVQNGRFHRDSLELACITAQGEGRIPTSIPAVFARPVRAARARSGTVNSQLSNGGDTPPLSPSGYSSGSQSSIDLDALKIAMQRADALNTLNSSTSLKVPAARLRPRGQGHSRPTSHLRNAFIAPIQEEAMSPAAVDSGFLFPQTTGHDSIHSINQITDASDTDDTAWLVALRRYHDLRTEANEEVEMSKRMWTDTQSSMLALQAFDPPSSPTMMKALLEQSQEAYGPLELRTRRISLRSRASPYGTTFSIHVQGSTSQLSLNSPSVLQEKSVNVPQAVPKAAPKATLAPKLAAKNSRPSARVESSPTVSPSKIRQRVPSATRRPILVRKGSAAPAASPREVKSTNKKENSPAPGIVLMSHNPSLRISRPRPKGRVTTTVPVSDARNRI